MFGLAVDAWSHVTCCGESLFLAGVSGRRLEHQESAEKQPFALLLDDKRYLGRSFSAAPKGKGFCPPNEYRRGYGGARLRQPDLSLNLP